MKKVVMLLFGSIVRSLADEMARERSIQTMNDCLSKGKFDARVFVVSDIDGNRLYEDLGLTEGDFTRLESLIESSVKSCKTWSLAMEQVSSKLRNNQELAYVCFRLGNLASAQANGIMKSHGDLLSGPGSIEDKLEQLAIKLGVPKDTILKMYQRFKKDNGME